MTEPLKQNTSGLYLDIQKVGCFFRSSCYMAEMVAERLGKPCRLSVDALNTLWDISVRFKYIVDRNVKNSAKIANAALKMLNVPGKFTEVATFQDGEMKWYGAVKNRRADFFIQKIKTKFEYGTHFRNVNYLGQLIWDPNKPQIQPQGIYYTICYRYDGENNGQIQQ